MNLFEQNNLVQAVCQGFIFWYPYLMSLFWIAGAIIFNKSRAIKDDLDKEAYEWPPISILVPCYNEANIIEETVSHLEALSYPKLEIIAVNDGSSDCTGEVLIRLSEKYKRLRVIDCRENKGKANALHIATHAARSEYLICIDSDALLDDRAPYYLVRQFLEKGERVGAVTGNPRIRNRDTLLGKIQLVEYASIIGMIKRTQRTLGKVMTVSGVIVAFRKKALLSVGLWDRDMITEDIAISWKLQRKFWDIRYEPRALCWMLVPETLSGLWKQRVRWAQGGQEVMIRHISIFKDWRQRRIWPIYIEQVTSTLWAIIYMIYMIYMIIKARSLGEVFMWISYSAFLLTMLSLIQLFLSIRSDSKYDPVMKYYIWVAWYPAIYWSLNTFIVIAALPKAIKSSCKGGYATWHSPDRGNIAEKEML